MENNSKWSQMVNKKNIEWCDLLSPSDKPLNTTEEVFYSIREALANGQLRPNQRLIETEIAKTLGVSRYPVHIALERLAAMGYIHRRNVRGFIVADITTRGIRNLFKIREALETMAIGLTCECATAERIKKAEEYHKKSLEVLPSKHRNATEFIKLNIAFYSELLNACGNDQLLSLLKIYSMDQRIYKRLTRVFTTKDWQTVYLQHNRIMEAVRLRNSNRAENAVKRHVRTEMGIALKRLDVM